MCRHHKHVLLDEPYTNRLKIAVESMVPAGFLPATGRTNLYSAVYSQVSHRYIHVAPIDQDDQNQPGHLSYGHEPKLSTVLSIVFKLDCRGWSCRSSPAVIVEPHTVSQALHIIPMELVHLPAILKKRKVWSILHILHPETHRFSDRVAYGCERHEVVCCGGTPALLPSCSPRMQ